LELKTGTSIAAAETTGVVAILLEWGIVKKEYPSINGIVIKQFLISGAIKSQDMKYPNPEWGYGILDIYETFLHLRQ
jgi:hypothetical protein